MSENKSSKNSGIHNRKLAAQGDVIIRQGDTGNEAYLIQSGKVRIYAEMGGKTKDLAVLGAGEIFGEMALVADEVRTASAVADEKTNLITITRPMIIEKLARTDPTIRALVPMLMNRIKRSNKAVFNKKETAAEMAELVLDIYGGYKQSLGAKQQVTLDKAVKPRLDAFLKALQDFQKLYDDV